MEIDNLVKRFQNNWKTDNPLIDYLNGASLTNRRGYSGNRFDDNTKRLFTYLYIKGGPACYESIYLNSVLPVAKSCKREITDSKILEVGKFYIEEYVEFLKAHEADCGEVIISEDATRLSDRVEYDPTSNQLFGLQPDHDETTGLPKINFFQVSTPSKLVDFLKKFKSSPYLQVVTAKLMKIGTPCRIISVFPTDNKYTTKMVIARWNLMKKKFNDHGFNIRMSSDADPRLLGAMKQLSKFGKKIVIRGLCMPLMCDIKSNVKSLSDPFHLLNNFKNRMNDTGKLKIGKFYVTMNYLKIMINHPDVSRNDHLLSNQDVGTFDTTKDKMNTTATRKVCEPKVIELLKIIPGSEGTVAYLRIMRSIYDAFINHERTDLERLYDGFWALSMIRRWRNNVGIGEREHFITNVNWTCLELNVAFLYEMIKKGFGKFLPIWNSQYCEETFRTLRAMTPSGLTQVNFTLIEALDRLRRVEKIHEITSKMKDLFVFPENLKIKSDVGSNATIRTEPPSDEECNTVISKANKDAELLCKSLGMKDLNLCDPEKFFKTPSMTEEAEELNTFLNENYGQEPILNDNFENLVLENMPEAQKNVVKFKNLYFIDEATGLFDF